MPARSRRYICRERPRVLPNVAMAWSVLSNKMKEGRDKILEPTIEEELNLLEPLGPLEVPY